MKTFFQTNQKRIIVLVAVAGIFALAASWTLAKSYNAIPLPRSMDADGTKWSKAVLAVSNLSCGGCIDTIRKSVATLPGTGEVMVDLASATAEVLFNGNRVKDPHIIAQVITDSGYPATIQRILDPAQLTQAEAQAEEKAKTLIATVGRFDVPRKDFEIELEHARSRYEQIYGAETFSTSPGMQLLQRIESQIALRLIDEAVKLQEVDRAGYVLPDGKVEQALAAFVGEKKTTLEELKRNMAANGYPFEYFMRKFKRRVKLQDYLEQVVLADSLDPADRQQRYGDWLTNTRTLAKVVYYDKNLEALVKAGSGSGCSGGGCSTSR